MAFEMVNDNSFHFSKDLFGFISFVNNPLKIDVDHSFSCTVLDAFEQKVTDGNVVH